MCALHVQTNTIMFDRPNLWMRITSKKIIFSEKINYALTITNLHNRLPVCVIHCDISDFIPVQGSCFLTIHIQQCLSNPAAVPKVAFQSTNPWQ